MIRIICVGTLKENYLKDAYKEYEKRIGRFVKIELFELKESHNSIISKALDEEAIEINKLLKGFTIKLAINGNIIDSVKLSSIIDEGIKSFSDVSFVIGSSNGLSPNVKCHYDLSISKMTFPHQLTRIILLEQIYRSFTILNNGKYHK